MKRRVIYFFSVIAFLFASCEMFQEPVKEYLEYWTNTIQVSTKEIVSPYVKINGIDNVSAVNNNLEFYLYLINPKKYNFEPNFSLECEGESLDNSSFVKIDDEKIKITATLNDSQQGKTISLSGYILPENKEGLSDTQLLDSNPELFYSCSFIQNTAPNSVTNLTESTNKIEGKFYTIFDIPNQSLNKNKDIKYKIQTYKRDSGTQQLTLIDEEIVSSSDNKNTSNNGKFYYYSDKQEENLGYEYSVTVLGKLNLISDKKSTDPGLGNCSVNDPEFSVDNSTEDSEVHSGYDTYTLNTKGADSTNFIINSKTGVSYKIKLDNGAYQNTDSISIPVGRHTVTIVSEKDRCEPNTYEKKLFIQGQLKDPEITYQNGYDDGTESKDGKTYEKMQFSYINYDELKVKFANLNGNGSTMKIEVNNKAPVNIENNSATTLLFDPDEYEDIKITQTKENYKTLVSKKYIKSIIFPVKLTYKDGENILKFYGNVSSSYLRGKIYLFTPTQIIWSGPDSGDDNWNGYNSISTNTWSQIKHHSGDSQFSQIIYSVSEKVYLKFYKIRGHVKGSGNSDHDFEPETLEEEKTLKEIKNFESESSNKPSGFPEKWVFNTKKYVYGNLNIQFCFSLTATDETCE